MPKHVGFSISAKIKNKHIHTIRSDHISLTINDTAEGSTLPSHFDELFTAITLQLLKFRASPECNAPPKTLVSDTLSRGNELADIEADKAAKTLPGCRPLLTYDAKCTLWREVNNHLQHIGGELIRSAEVMLVSAGTSTGSALGSATAE